MRKIVYWEGVVIKVNADGSARVRISCKENEASGETSLTSEQMQENGLLYGDTFILAEVYVTETRIIIFYGRTHADINADIAAFDREQAKGQEVEPLDTVDELISTVTEADDWNTNLRFIEKVASGKTIECTQETVNSVMRRAEEIVQMINAVCGNIYNISNVETSDGICVTGYNSSTPLVSVMWKVQSLAVPK